MAQGSPPRQGCYLPIISTLFAPLLPVVLTRRPGLCLQRFAAQRPPSRCLEPSAGPIALRMNPDPPPQPTCPWATPPPHSLSMAAPASSVPLTAGPLSAPGLSFPVCAVGMITPLLPHGVLVGVNDGAVPGQVRSVTEVTIPFSIAARPTQFQGL